MGFCRLERSFGMILADLGLGLSLATYFLAISLPFLVTSWSLLGSVSSSQFASCVWLADLDLLSLATFWSLLGYILVIAASRIAPCAICGHFVRAAWTIVQIRRTPF